MQRGDRLRIFTWHIHGSYLFYLAHCNIDIYIPVLPDKREGYIGRGQTFPFDDNVIEVEAAEVNNLSFDCILFQSPHNYQVDQYNILTEDQRRLPRIYLEHNPPCDHPVDMKHVVDDDDTVVVHVTHFNRLMWDNHGVRTVVIDHGVSPGGATYTGELQRGIVVINHLKQRGRRLGLDVFQYVQRQVPVDLIGMGSEEIGGLGEVLHPRLPDFIKQYRFFFNPIRYTSLGLAVLEAMSIGLPIVGLATTEMAAVFENGVSAWVHTDVDYLIAKMKMLLQDPIAARYMGDVGRKKAVSHFSIARFTKDWEALFYKVVDQKSILVS